MDKASPLESLSDWYQTPLGRMMYQAVQHRLEHVLPSLHGLTLLQLGEAHSREWLDASNILHKLVVNFSHRTPRGDFHADVSALPIANASADVVFLPFLLGFIAQPEALLHEVERILVPHGHLILVDFNPWSLWGLKRVFSQQVAVPWCGNFISAWTIRRWLHPTGLRVLDQFSLMYRPPLENQAIFYRLSGIEAVGEAILPLPGGAYLIVAKKQVTGMTPVKPIMSFRNLVVGRRHGQPTTDGATFNKPPCSK